MRSSGLWQEAIVGSGVVGRAVVAIKHSTEHREFFWTLLRCSVALSRQHGPLQSRPGDAKEGPCSGQGHWLSPAVNFELPRPSYVTAPVQFHLVTEYGHPLKILFLFTKRIGTDPSQLASCDNRALLKPEQTSNYRSSNGVEPETISTMGFVAGFVGALPSPIHSYSSLPPDKPN